MPDFQITLINQIKSQKLIFTIGLSIITINLLSLYIPITLNLKFNLIHSILRILISLSLFLFYIYLPKTYNFKNYYFIKFGILAFSILNLLKFNISNYWVYINKFDYIYWYITILINIILFMILLTGYVEVIKKSTQ